MAQAQALQSYNCPATPEGEHGIHEKLFEYAVLAELVYDDHDAVSLKLHTRCSAIRSQENIQTVTFHRVSKEIINHGVRSFLERNPNRIVTIDGDEELVSCSDSSQTFPQRLAVAYRYVRQNDQLTLLVKFAILGVATVSGSEEFRILRLQRNGEEILGIQGTDFTRLPQWNTSIQNLIANSCLFDLSVEVVTHFFGQNPGSDEEFSHTIVGHSLGGAVVQHVAQHAKSTSFQGYSFNSIGVSPTPNAVPDDRIKSVRIAGEILENMEKDFQRRQIGHIYRYGVTLGGSSTDPRPLSDRIRLHGIQAVQDAICECLENRNGREIFEYAILR